MTEETDYNKFELPEPFAIGSVNVWGEQLNSFFRNLDEQVIRRGSLNERPSAGTKGRLYYVPDSSQLFVDTGSTWRRTGAQVEVRDSGSRVMSTPDVIDFGQDLSVTNPSSGVVEIDSDGGVSTSGDTMTGVLTMEADIDSATAGTIWDESNQYIPQGRLEHDSFTISGGTGIDGDSGTLNGVASVSVNEADNFTWTGTHDFTSASIQVPEPSNDSDAADKAYVDSVAAGLSIKESVVAATDGTSVDLTSSTDPNPIDGVTLSDGDRVLLKDQSDGTENGIYDASTATDPTTWSRSADMDSDADVVSGSFTFVTEGTTNGNAGFVVSTEDPISVGSDVIEWAQFSTSAGIAAGDGLTKNGDTLHFDPVDGLEIDANGRARINEDYSASWTADHEFRADILDAASNIVYDQSNNWVPADRVEQGDGSGLDADTVDGIEGDDLAKSKNLAQLTSTDTTTDINKTSWTDIEFDVENKLDAAYTHDSTNTPAEITFDEAGTYRVSVSLSYDVTDSHVNPGIKFNVNGTRLETFGLTGYTRNTDNHNEASNTVSRLIDVSAGDTLRIQSIKRAGDGEATLRAEESVLTIEQLSATVGTTGDADTLDGLDATAFVRADGSNSMSGTLGINKSGGTQFERLKNTDTQDELRVGSDSNDDFRIASYDSSTDAENGSITMDVDAGSVIIEGGLESTDAATFNSNVSISGNVDFSTGNSLKDGSGNNRLSIVDSTQTVLLDGNGDYAFSASDATANTIYARSDQPVRINDTEQNADALEYLTDGTDGYLRYKNSALNIEGSDSGLLSDTVTGLRMWWDAGKGTIQSRDDSANSDKDLEIRGDVLNLTGGAIIDFSKNGGTDLRVAAGQSIQNDSQTSVLDVTSSGIAVDELNTADIAGASAGSVPVADGNGNLTMSSSGSSGSVMSVESEQDQDVLSGTEVTVEFDTENKDTLSEYDGTAHTFQPNTTGWYLISAQVTMDGGGSNDDVEAKFVNNSNNNTRILQRRQVIDNGVYDDLTMTLTKMVKLDSNSTYEIRAQNRDSSDTIISGTERTYFTAQRVDL